MDAEIPKYRGISHLDMTTSGYIKKPEEAFALTNEINKNRPSDEWMGIEIYPSFHRLLLNPLITLAEKTPLLIPGEITAEQVKEWTEKEYPHTKVIRVHLPFSYNNEELLEGLINRANDAGAKLRQAAWIVFLGGAANKRGVQLAEQLGVEINAHANIIVGFAKDRQLEKIKQQVPAILVESEAKHTTPLLRNPDAFSEPSVVIHDIVERFQLDGLVMGVEHGLKDNVDLLSSLDDEKVRHYTKAMHLAGTKDHSIFLADDPKVKAFLDKARVTDFDHEVRGALDFDPREVRKLSGQQQIDLVEELRSFILGDSSSL